MGRTQHHSCLVERYVYLREREIRAVITLACSTRHVGSIYQVCNFKCYGKSDPKCDFFSEDGKINPRGSTKNARGVWLPRPIKYRYAYILDKSLQCNYAESTPPRLGELTKNECCGGTNVVRDNRFGDYYTCPRCTGKLQKLTEREWLTAVLEAI